MLIRRAGLLGLPIAHSLSPVIHNAGYAAAGLAGWSYLACECAATGLAEHVAGLDRAWAGLSLTMPLKEVALDVADEVSPAAAAIGAANTLVRLPDGSWRAENTDAAGMVDAVRAAGVGQVERVGVLGAGGTARAALAAARSLAAPAVTVYARRPAALTELERVADRLGITLVAAGWEQAGTAGECDLLVSTVPRGVADALAASVCWRPGGALFDVVYDPWPTPLAAAAANAGCRLISGLDLLLAQAARQFELFTGVPAPVAAMRTALDAAAGARA